MTEQDFTTIPGFENYEISRVGVVRNKTTKHVLKPFAHKKYLRVELWRRPGFRRPMVHRLVALVYVPNPSGYLHINHKNGTQHDNRMENLEWCTPQQNIAHAMLHKLLPHGDGHHTRRSVNRTPYAWHPKLAAEQRSEIRALRIKGVSSYVLAKQFGVSRALVHKITSTLTSA